MPRRPLPLNKPSATPTSEAKRRCRSMKTGRRRKYCSPVTYTTVSLLSSPVGTLVVDFSIRGSARFGLALVAPLRRGPTTPFMARGATATRLKALVVSPIGVWARPLSLAFSRRSRWQAVARGDTGHAASGFIEAPIPTSITLPEKRRGYARRDLRGMVRKPRLNVRIRCETHTRRHHASTRTSSKREGLSNTSFPSTALPSCQ